MAKIIDITNKLDLEKKTIKIFETVVAVNDDAETALKIIGIISRDKKDKSEDESEDKKDESEDKKDELEGVKEAYNLLFSEEDREKISSLNLNLTSFMTLVRAAMSIVMGENEEEEQGEEKTPAMT
ncbi:MAG: hypothetical protein ACI4F9_00955 [Lachnospiraceae bacterium]